ncbi:hypothetical protein DXG03_003341 [Asterophora parasitica]|uniref:Glucose-methanol-choline oxidoreductase N-terminal domain-containing protein n=1 Tax=Asterophora parasitica TaxID=117018 RepID=A0A9P7G1N7_9AGAR|nr:hypothetical protein DXG03_003341 [Asterophora parasitica]
MHQLRILSDLPTTSTHYDFIVVGGGTAGNVTNRLSENPAWRILVIESGPSHEGVLQTSVPFFFNRFFRQSQYNWTFTTTPQQALHGRITEYPQGHILGGGTSTKGMFYTRGSSSDFDRFARVTGNPGWSWENLQPYIRNNEQWATPADSHDAIGKFDPSVNGVDGIDAVTLPGLSRAADALMVQASRELVGDFPFNQDMNSGSPLGLGWIPSTIKGGKRSSSATPHLVERKNLDVLFNTRVTRFFRTGDS